tara:strand:+ start:5089 stop:6549 length:1461 start_codon:yes stop_codon:yes gene_type:complete
LNYFNEFLVRCRIYKMFLKIMVRKLKNKLFKKITQFLILKIIRFSIIIKIKSISVLSFIIYLAISSNQNFLIYLYKILIKKNKPYIIFLEKAGFNEDTKIIKNTFKDIECIGFSRSFIKGIAKFYLSKEIDDNSYFSCSPIHHGSKKRLFNFYNVLFQKLPSRAKPVAILTGNFGYFPEQELFKAASKNQIKGIAIHKECIKPSGIYELWKYVYSVRRGVFGGTLILNYNEIEAEIQRVSQVIDTKKTRMEVIGCPRLDDAHSLRKNYSLIKNHQVLIFGFGEKSFLPKIPRKSPEYIEPYNEYLDRNDKQLSWENLINELCSSIYKCAKQNPSVPFIIKLKDVYRENNKMISFFDKKEKLNNIKILTSSNALSLLKNSSIVISHRSTTLFEGIARGIPVIIPNLGECQIQKYKPYIFEFSSNDRDLITVNNSKQLIKNLNYFLNKDPKVEIELSKSKKKILEKWMGNSDGKSSKRLISMMKKELR